MPLGWERINVKKTLPNKNIVFIKPRPGRDEATSRDYLERIAAQCLPVMNNNHLSVVSLEEFPPNHEFWGRNFNNGEVIQLVLKSPSTGRWLPFRFVQMIMMHELAHNKQMNHSAAFHKVRVGFTNEMKALWEKGYTGDGFWGRGTLLVNGAFDDTELAEGEILPEHLCGGTFMSRGSKKRKAKTKITWKEQKERRVAKKFGTNGVTLGADEYVKTKLEKGKKPVGKPRVAGSARGRELRAAAALARFETQKEEPQLKDEDLVTDSEVESDAEIDIKQEPDDAVDIDGSWLLGPQGLPLVKVCEDEDGDGDNAKNELLELQNLGRSTQKPFLSKELPRHQPVASELLSPLKSSMQMQPISPQTDGKPPKASNEQITPEVVGESCSGLEKASKDKATTINDHNPRHDTISGSVKGSCLVCSMENDSTALTCMACSNVLKPEFVPDSWRCEGLQCQGSRYLNAGDVRLCGVCGARKCSEGT